MEGKRLVSVCLITYNHSAYVADAIDGVLAQQTTFDWDLVIADDCSTDGTRDILIGYQNRYPGKIKLILQERNVGPYRNWMDLMAFPDSKYVAYLEGDDYWIDKLKLQQQIEILEGDNTIAACGHNVNVFHVNDDRVVDSESNVSSVKRTSLAEVGFGMPCHSCSLVVRNMPLSSLPWLAKCPAGDWPWLAIAMTRGGLVILPKVMSVYRQNVGVWSSSSRQKQVRGIIDTVNEMLQATEFNDLFEFRKNLTRTKIQYLKELQSAGEADHQSAIRDEISIVDYYEDVVTRLQTAFKNKDELAARVPVSTLVKALFTKFNRKISK